MDSIALEVGQGNYGETSDEETSQEETSQQEVEGELNETD